MNQSPSWTRLSAPAVTEVLALDHAAITWILHEAPLRGIQLVGAHHTPEGGWTPTDPKELLQRPEPLRQLHQRAGCKGWLSKVTFGDPSRPWGSLLENRAPGQPESSAWRLLLLQAVVRTAQRI